MGKEIERNFLVVGDGWRSGDMSRIRQGYLNTDPERSIRVRTRDGEASLTIKGEARGTSRAEFEYPIPLEDANEILETLCLEPLIEKRRYLVEHGDLTWEVDEFQAANQGLIIAEVELEDEDQATKKPP